MYSGEIYEYYNHKYDKSIDKENIKRKWDKVIGGLIGTENRQKFIFEHKEQVNPGPGRYNPSIHYAKYNNGSAGYMGIKVKTNGIMVPTGTHGTDVAPTSYEIGEKSDVHKFVYSPKYSFGGDVRKSLGKTIPTKHETYAVVSSCGEQILAQKDSRPQFTFGKEPRFKN